MSILGPWELIYQVVLYLEIGCPSWTLGEGFSWGVTQWCLAGLGIS